MYIAQYQANHLRQPTGCQPYIRLLVADPGPRMSAWREVADELTGYYPKLVAVVGLTISRTETVGIARRIDDAGIPVVLTAHDLKAACPAYRMANANGVCERCRDGSLLNVIGQRCIKNSFAASAVVAPASSIRREISIIQPSAVTRRKPCAGAPRQSPGVLD